MAKNATVALLDDLDAAFPEIRAVELRSQTDPERVITLRMVKPAYGDVLKLRKRLLRKLEDLRESGMDGDKEREFGIEERLERVKIEADALWEFNVGLIRLCVHGGFRNAKRKWSDDRIRDLVERTKPAGAESSPLMEAACRLAGLRDQEVGGEDDPFGYASATDGV